MPEEIAHEWPVHIKSIDIPKKRRPESSSYSFFPNLKRPRINPMFRDDSSGEVGISGSTTELTPYGESASASDDYSPRSPIFRPRDSNSATLKSSLRGSISSLLRERIEARASLLAKPIAPQSLKRDSRSGRVDFEDPEEEIKEEPPMTRVPISLLSQRMDDFYGVHSDDSLSSMSSMSSDDDDDDDDELDNPPLPMMASRFLRPPAENKPTASAPFFLSGEAPRFPNEIACLTASNFDDEDEDVVYQPDFLL